MCAGLMSVSSFGLWEGEVGQGFRQIKIKHPDDIRPGSAGKGAELDSG